MAKTKTQKELLAAVKESPIAYNYDLTRVDAREYAAPLQVLFNSAIWKDIFIRRNTLYRSAMTGNADAFKQMGQIDRKVATLILQAMFTYSNDRARQRESSKVTLREFFEDFVRTPEQHEIYEKFSASVDSALTISDILETVLGETKEHLTALDPSLVLSEFDSIKASMKALSDFSHIQHRDEHPQLCSLFCDMAEEVEEYVIMKVSLYRAQYKNLRDALIAKGEIKDKPIKKHTDREYLSDIIFNIFYLQGDTKDDKTNSIKKSQRVISQFTDQELQEVMQFLIDYYRCLKSVDMASDKKNTLIKTLPETEATKKIVDHIL